MAMFMLPVSALDVAGIERKLLQTMEMITAKKKKVGKLVVVKIFQALNELGGQVLVSNLTLRCNSGCACYKRRWAQGRGSIMVTCSRYWKIYFTTFTLKVGENEDAHSRRHHRKCASAEVRNFTILSVYMKCNLIVSRADILALEELSKHLFLELHDLQNMRERIDWSKSCQGKYFNFLGYFFSLYCVWKIFISTVNIVFDRVGKMDPITKTFDILVNWFGFDIDMEMWSQQLSWQLTGRDESEVCSHAISPLSLLLMKGNSAILVNRIPTAPRAPSMESMTSNKKY